VVHQTVLLLHQEAHGRRTGPKRRQQAMQKVAHVQARLAASPTGATHRLRTELEGAQMTSEWVVAIGLIVLVVGYIGSLWLNPWVKCSRCRNKPVKKGLIFGYAHHSCPKCKGTGQQLRFGRRILFGRPK
jgi:DnaJ-class molecular chaperone